MVIWQLLVIIGLAFLVLEMFTPVMFFLNFAIAAFITAIASIFINDINILLISFTVIALVLLLFLRPMLMNRKTSKSQTTGMENKYIGKTAKVIETITQTSGAISIYDERWEARILDNNEIPVGENVKIVRYDSLIMFVERN